MSSLPNQPDVENIVSAFESAQNQSWSKFNDKLGSIPIKDCKKKDIFKSENPIELADEDIPVFGLVPRLEKLVLVSCNKCSMIVKSDCIHYHYKHRHNNPENDLFSVAQFIVPNVKTNKHKRPKLNIRKLPEKKIIDGVNIDPIIQEIKTEFDQVEFERLSELKRATKQQGNIIQYDGESTSVDLALHCTPGTSYFNELCTQSLVQYPNQNEENNQIIDYNEDLTKSVGIIKELQNNKSIDDIDDSNNEHIVHYTTKVESNDKRKRRIDCTGLINDDEEFYENNHPKKKYHVFPLKENYQEHSSFKTNNSCSNVIRNQNSDNVFTCDQDVNIEIPGYNNNLKKLLSNGEEFKTINFKGDVDGNTIDSATRTSSSANIISTNLKSFDLKEKNTPGLNLTDIIDNCKNENKSNRPLIKRHRTIIGSDMMKNKNVDHLEKFKKADGDKNLNELLDDETKLKNNKHFNNISCHKIVNETSSELNPIQQLDSNRKIKCKTDCSDVINDGKEYDKNNQNSNNKYHKLPLKPHSYLTRHRCSSVMNNSSFDSASSCDGKVNDKTTEHHKDSNKLLNVREKLHSKKCSNDNINENIVNYFTVSNEPLNKLLNLNKKEKHRKKSKKCKDKNDKHFYENKSYSKNKYYYLPFESPNFTSAIEYEEDEYKEDETNVNSNIFYLPLPPKSNNDNKPKKFIPIEKFIKDLDNQYSSASVSSFHKPSIVKHEKVEDQINKLNSNCKSVNLSIPSRLLDDEKIKKYTPMNKYVTTMDDSSDSHTNFCKPSTTKYKEDKDEMEEINVDSKIVCLPLPFKSLNCGKSEKCVTVNGDITAIKNQCSSDSVLSFNEPLNIKNEEVEDKMVKINPDSQIIYYPLSYRLENDKKFKKCVPKLVKTMEVQCPSNFASESQNSPSLKYEEIKNEMDQINVNSNVIYLKLPPKSLIDEKPIKHLPTNEFVKEIDSQYNNDSITINNNPPSVKHEQEEGKIDKINANSKYRCLPEPSRSLNDNKSYIPMSEFIDTIDDDYFSDSDYSFDNSSSDEHVNVKDEISEINMNSNIIYFPLPFKSQNDIKQEYINEQYSSDSSSSFHKSVTIEHDNSNDEMGKINMNSKILYFPLPPKSFNDVEPKKYIPFSKFVKTTEYQHSHNPVCSFYKSSNVEPKDIKDKINKMNVYSKIFQFPLPSKSLNSPKPKKYILINKFFKATDNQCFDNSVTTCKKLLTTSENVKENIKVASNDTFSNNLNDGDENNKSKIKLYHFPSKITNNNIKMTYLSTYNNSKVLNNNENSEKIIFNNDNSTISSSNIEEEAKFALNKYTVLKHNKHPDDADICYNHPSTVLQEFKNESKSSFINDYDVQEEYCFNSRDIYYQGLNDYTLSQVLKPISSVTKHLDYDINTSSGKELCSKTRGILKNDYCSSSKFQSNKKEIKLESMDAYTDIINNGYYDDAFISYDLSSTSSLVKKEMIPLSLIDDSNVLTYNASRNDHRLSAQTLNNQMKAQSLQNTYLDNMCNEDSNTSASSNDQSSLSSIDIKENTQLSFKDIFSDNMSDENSNNVAKLQENVMTNNKCTQTDGFSNLQHFIDPIIRVDKSMSELPGTNDIDDKTEYSQTNLFKCMYTNETTKKLIDYTQANSSNDELVENLMNSYTSDVTRKQISEYTSNSCTTVSSNAKSVNSTTTNTSIEECELKKNHNCNNFISNNLHSFQNSLYTPESYNKHFSNCKTHHSVSDNNQWLENYNKICSTYTDKTVQNECYSKHKINETTSDVDKYFRSYKERLKKITDEKLVNSKNWKIISHDNIEAKRRKCTKRRLEAKVVDDKENYGLWDLTESFGYNRTFNFVLRPALRQSHFSDESD